MQLKMQHNRRHSLYRQTMYQHKLKQIKKMQQQLQQQRQQKVD
jgi:hypothetical protein